MPWFVLIKCASGNCSSGYLLNTCWPSYELHDSASVFTSVPIYRKPLYIGTWYIVPCTYTFKVSNAFCKSWIYQSSTFNLFASDSMQ